MHRIQDCGALRLLTTCDYFLFSTLSPLDWAGPVPAPLSVPEPGFPPEATGPDAPPTIPVSVPFCSTTSVPLPGTGAGSEDEVVGAGVAGGVDGVV